MAIPSKKNIDFNVYERQDPTTQVDWGAQATKITKKFEGIRDERQGRKDLLEKNIEEQRVALNDIGEYDSQNLRQLALKSSQQSAEELARKADLMRRGIVKPNELMQFKSNQSAGWTLFKKNAENWNGKFVEYTERMNAVPPLSSKLEQQLAQSLAGFGNLENMSYLSDDDGNMSYVRTDEEGNIIPGESMSANELTNLLNQKIDNYDSVAAAKSAGDAIGVIVNEILTENGINATIRSDARSRAESEFFGSEKAATVLRTHAETMTAVAQDLAVMLTQNVKIPNTDTVYEGDYGGKLHDAWAKENSDKHQSLNPYIAMRMKSGTYVPDVTKEQKAVATEYAEGLIKSTLNITIGVDTKGMNEKDKEPQRSAAEISKTERDAKLLSKGKNLMYAVSGDKEKSKAGIQYIVDASNGNISGIKKTDTGFTVQYPDADPFDVNTEDMTPTESMMAMWKSAGLQEDEFDAWLTAGGTDLLKDRKTTRDAQNITGPQKAIKYDMNATFQNDDGVEITAKDWVNKTSLGGSLNSLNDTNIEVVDVFTKLLTKESFFPKEFNGSVRMDGDKMYFTINNKEYKVNDDVFAMDTGDIVGEMQSIIQDVIQKRKDGGVASGF